VLSVSGPSVVSGQPFRTGRKTRKDGRNLHRRRFNQDLGYLSVRAVVLKDSEKPLRKNTRVDIQHAIPRRLAALQ